MPLMTVLMYNTNIIEHDRTCLTCFYLTNCVNGNDFSLNCLETIPFGSIPKDPNGVRNCGEDGLIHVQNRWSDGNS